MTKIVRMTSEDPLSAKDMEELRTLASRPDSAIDTEDIPEKTIDFKAAAQRRRDGWRPGVVRQKKAS